MLAMLIMANQVHKCEDAKGLLKKIEQIKAYLELRSGIMPNLANIENPTEDQEQEALCSGCD